MNIMSLLMGDLARIATEGVADKFISKHIPQLKGLDFSSLLSGASADPDSNKLSIEDLDLTKQEEAQILDIKNYAINKGMKEIEIVIHGQVYELDTSDLSLSPVLTA
jgi:hypothetical protein